MVQSQIYTKYHHFTIYDLLDRPKTVKEAENLMEIFQRNWRRTKKRGGMVSSHYDVMQAILSLMPKTMEEMKKEQRSVFDWSIANNEFFCFTNNAYIAKMVNGDISSRTVARAIEKLIEAKIITKKVNYLHTGKDNPTPVEEHPRGRGKFKLVINNDILVWGKVEAELNFGEAKSDSDFSTAEAHSPLRTLTTCPQMYSILDNKDKLKQCNTPTANVDKVSPNGDAKKNNIVFSEQRSKQNPFVQANSEAPKNGFSSKVFIPSDLSNKEEFFARHLFEQARVALWNGANFNQAIVEQSVDLMLSHLRLTKDYVQLYRKKRIEEFKDSAYYKSFKNNPKHQWKLLNTWFSNKLPDVELSAVRILSEAIQKQRENAIKRDYLDRIYKPQYYFVSDKWEIAMNYSKEDFLKIYTKYGPENLSLSYYQMVMEHINKAHTAILQALKDGTTEQYAMNVCSEHWKKLRVMIAKAPSMVSQEQRDKLIRKFKERLQPIFSNKLT